MENGSNNNPLSDLGSLLDFKKIGSLFGFNQKRSNTSNNPLKMITNMFNPQASKINQRRAYRSTVKVFPLEEAYRRIKSGNIFLLDVRTEMEYKCIRIKGSVNIPLDRLQFEIESILKNKQEIILIYCSTGSRVRRAIQILWNMGYDNLYIWEGAGLNTFAFQDLIVYNNNNCNINEQNHKVGNVINNNEPVAEPIREQVENNDDLN